MTPRSLNADELKTLMGIDALFTLTVTGVLAALDALGVAPVMDVVEALAVSGADRAARLSLGHSARNYR
jgi:hypothetical protein